MRRLVAGEGYARARSVSGALYIVLGIVVLVEVGLRVPTAGWRVIPLVVFGLAMAGLGIVRIRSYVTRPKL